MKATKVEDFASYKAGCMRTLTSESACREYLTRGLLGEVGEVAGKFAKVIRDNHSVMSEERKEQIKAELGDCAWFMACMVEVLHLPLNKVYCEVKGSMLRTTHEEEYLLANLAGGVSLILVERDKTSMATEINRCWNDIAQLATRIGCSMREVCQANLDKLAARYNAGTIQGNGDGITDRAL